MCFQDFFFDDAADFLLLRSELVDAMVQADCNIDQTTAIAIATATATVTATTTTMKMTMAMWRRCGSNRVQIKR
jgi:hypothetical protein